MNTRHSPPHLEAVVWAWSLLAAGFGLTAAAAPPTPTPTPTPTLTVREVATGLLKSPEKSVRLAAIRVIGQEGTVADVPVLIGLAATGGDAERAEAASSLVSMRGEGIDQAIVAAVKADDVQTRLAVIRCLADRRPPGALAAVLGLFADATPEVREEALRAVEPMADVGAVPALVALLEKSAAGPEREGVETAIAAACRRQSDPQRRAAPLLAMMAGADAAKRSLLLPVIGRVGGDEALAAIQAARQDADEGTREAAIRGLCNWPDSVVAPELLAVAREASNPEHRTWAVRALARVVPRKVYENLGEASQMMQDTFKLAQRPEDKKLVLSRMAAVRTPESLAVAVESTADANLRDEGLKTVVELARAMWLTPHQPAVRAALEKIRPLVTDPELKARIERIIENPDALRKG